MWEQDALTKQLHIPSPSVEFGTINVLIKIESITTELRQKTTKTKKGHEAHLAKLIKSLQWKKKTKNNKTTKTKNNYLAAKTAFFLNFFFFPQSFYMRMNSQYRPMFSETSLKDLLNGQNTVLVDVYVVCIITVLIYFQMNAKHFNRKNFMDTNHPLMNTNRGLNSGFPQFT